MRAAHALARFYAAVALALDKVVEQFEDALPVLVVLGVVARLMVLVLEVVVVIGVRLPRHIFMRGRDRRLAIHVCKIPTCWSTFRNLLQF